ncbi:hypothetical protein JOE58_002272 [Curtobacterium luteum]|uniref:CBM-cenC domain-containing protein n=1 Tax=Curtobacterium luteum TaxID=33881 RepID=A0ABS2RVN1_9MICO|nr:hypothetical protein [Curtobacterium luteum]MBM7803021.1 hypothetical protein [Curtobacterium luteum]NUU50674.1 hypothetical protein [Curtobacterium luteum]
MHHLTAGVWTKIGLWATVENTGSPVALRVFTTDDTSGGGPLLIDDCSVVPEP